MRFPEFSGEWEKTSIGECFSKVENGLTYDTDNTSGVPVTRIETISDKSINYDRVGYANIDDKISKYEMQYGDVLFSHINSLKHIGKTAFYDAAQPLYHGMNLLLLRAKKSLDSKFLYYTLNTHKFLHRCQVLANQAVNQASINTKELKSINISIPQMQEQQKISGLISLLDERIETQKKIIEDLKRLKDAITHSHYRNELSHSPMAYIGQYITQVSKRNKDARIDRVLSVSNKYGFINQDEQFEDREVASADTSNYKIVHKGDFAYNPARINVGSVARLQEFENGIVSPMYVCFTANKGLLPAYFELYLSTGIFKHEMNKRLEGSVRLCLTYESLCNIKIALPEFNVQKDFVSKVSTILTKIRAEERLLYLYHNCKQYLLSQMFI